MAINEDIESKSASTFEEEDLNEYSVKAKTTTDIIESLFNHTSRQKTKAETSCLFLTKT